MLRGKRVAIKSAIFLLTSCQTYLPMIVTSSKAGRKDTNIVKQTPSPDCSPLYSTDNNPCGRCCATSLPKISFQQ